jgi:hypothetical protein
MVTSPGGSSAKLRSGRLPPSIVTDPSQRITHSATSRPEPSASVGSKPSNKIRSMAP